MPLHGKAGLSADGVKRALYLTAFEDAYGAARLANHVMLMRGPASQVAMMLRPPMDQLHRADPAQRIKRPVNGAPGSAHSRPGEAGGELLGRDPLRRRVDHFQNHAPLTGGPAALAVQRGHGAAQPGVTGQIPGRSRLGTGGAAAARET